VGSWPSVWSAHGRVVRQWVSRSGARLLGIVGAVVVSIIGRPRWEAPTWVPRLAFEARRLGRWTRSHPTRALGLLLLVAASALGAERGHRYWQSRPRPPGGRMLRMCGARGKAVNRGARKARTPSLVPSSPNSLSLSLTQFFFFFVVGLSLAPFSTNSNSWPEPQRGQFVAVLPHSFSSRRGRRFPTRGCKQFLRKRFG
jgi:hypothetical protein